jgi:hypothetical protein
MPAGYAMDPRQQSQEEMVAPARAPKRRRKSGGTWKVVLQFVIGLGVIAGVATAIVVLYLRYYQ